MTQQVWLVKQVATWFIFHYWLPHHLDLWHNGPWNGHGYSQHLKKRCLTCGAGISWPYNPHPENTTLRCCTLAAMPSRGCLALWPLDQQLPEPPKLQADWKIYIIKEMPGKHGKLEKDSKLPSLTLIFFFSVLVVSMKILPLQWPFVCSSRMFVLCHVYVL